MQADWWWHPGSSIWACSAPTSRPFISAASRALGTPLPTVSRRVSDLEAHLGAQLLVRTARRLILTEAGEAFVASARRIIEELGEAERAASGEYREPRGELVVTAPIRLRRERLIKRDGISEKLANQMIEAQISDKERLAHATYHVRNDGDTTHLYEQMKSIVEKWREAGWL